MNKQNVALVISFFVVLALGCGGSRSSRSSVSPEVQARIDWASQTSKNYPYRVAFVVRGENKDVLGIEVSEEVPAYSASAAVKMIITEKLKQDATSLGFKQIHIEGGRKSLTSSDTINQTMPLP